jgi:hypothetical protein
MAIEQKISGDFQLKTQQFWGESVGIGERDRLK